MNAKWSWEAWVEQWKGDPDEDLSLTLKHVRLQRLRKTQEIWARDPRTRAFCDLGAYLLYQHHLSGQVPSSEVPEIKFFRNLGGEDLMRAAAEVIPDAELAGQLDRQRWAETWAHHGAFVSDLIAYIFRSAPTVRRIREVHTQLANSAQTMALADLIRAGAQAELKSALSDPILALQTFIEAALPHQPGIRAAVRRIEHEMIAEWAGLYEVLLEAYGLTLRPGVTTLDVAELFDTVIEGALLRARSRGDMPRTSAGDDMLTAAIMEMLPTLCDCTRNEINERMLSQPAIADG